MKHLRKAPQPEADEGPPAWIVSFSDMITLLLAFFVLLQAFAHVQDPELFFIGRDSFRRAIAGMGVPDLLFGKQERPRFEHPKPKYTTEEAKNKIPKNRILDAEDERIRQAFARLRRMVETRSSELRERHISTYATPIRFAPSQARLNPSAREYLSALARDLKQGLSHRAITVQMIGLAAKAETGPAGQWRLSAQRAKSVQDFLEDACADGVTKGRWKFLSWGVAAGGKWTEKLGLISDKPYVVIVVTGE